MPVKRLMKWTPSEKRRVADLDDDLKLLSDCALSRSIHGRKDGSWRSEMVVYTESRPKNPSLPPPHGGLVGLSLHEQPEKHYLVHRRSVVEADQAIVRFIVKPELYKVYDVISIGGHQFKIGDFRLRLGEFHSRNHDSRGLMMELEYLPSSSIELATPLLEEFYVKWRETIAESSLRGFFGYITSNFPLYGLTGDYTSNHTAVTYATCMLRMMKP